MGKFIEEFYYGNIDPQARSTKQNKAVQKQMEVLMLNVWGQRHLRYIKQHHNRRYCLYSFSHFTNKTFEAGRFVGKYMTFPRLIAKRNGITTRVQGCNHTSAGNLSTSASG